MERLQTQPDRETNKQQHKLSNALQNNKLVLFKINVHNKFFKVFQIIDIIIVHIFLEKFTKAHTSVNQNTLCCKDILKKIIVF